MLLVEQIKAALCQRFEMTDLGTLHFFLGLEIQQTPGGMFVSQQRYVLELLEKFQMREARPISSPMDPNEKLSSNEVRDWQMQSATDSWWAHLFGYSTPD